MDKGEGYPRGRANETGVPSPCPVLNRTVPRKTGREDFVQRPDLHRHTGGDLEGLLWDYQQVVPARLALQLGCRLLRAQPDSALVG